jgi:hypothetical protein
MVILSLHTFAQSDEADISKMGHFKLRAYLKEHGLKASTGQLVKVGDTLIVGKGTLPDKRFAFIFESAAGFGTGTSFDGSNKAYLKSGAVGRKAIVKAFMTSGMRKGEYTIWTVVGVGEIANYYIELDNALDAGEIKFKQ